MANKPDSKCDAALVAMATRLYKQGFERILHPKLQESLLDLFCRGEEFAQAKKDVYHTLDGLK